MFCYVFRHILSHVFPYETLYGLKLYLCCFVRQKVCLIPVIFTLIMKSMSLVFFQNELFRINAMSYRKRHIKYIYTYICRAISISHRYISIYLYGYKMPDRSCPISIVHLLYKNGLDFLSILYV